MELRAEGLDELARLAKAGDEQAFRRLIERTHSRLYRIALHMLRNQADAEEVVQESYTRAWRQLRTLSEVDRVEGWLARIAANAAKDRLRWWRRRREISLDAPTTGAGLSATLVSEARAADEKIGDAEVIRAVRDAIDRLPEKLRLVVTLKELEGMTSQEVADMLAVPLGTVDSRLFRARSVLARALTKRTDKERP